MSGAGNGEPRIAIVGTGANGAGIGADLVNAGLDVTFIEQWPAHVDAMREHGVTVILPTGETTVTPVTAHNLCEVATLRRLWSRPTTRAGRANSSSPSSNPTALRLGCKTA